jgi:RNA polymerase-binding transcription factor DksA
MIEKAYQTSASWGNPQRRHIQRLDTPMNDPVKIRKQLLTLHTELQQQLDRTQSEERHEVEEGEDTTAQFWEASEIRDGLNDEAVSQLRDVDRALARLDAGDYGICTSCDKPIDPRRLEVPPYVELCVLCAEQLG